MKDYIIRKAKNRDNPYSIIANSAIWDWALSWKATGLLVYLLSMPDNWQANIVDLTNRKQDGRDSTATALKQLVSLGYIEKRRYRDTKGRFLRYEYVVHEQPYRTETDVRHDPDNIPDNIFARAEFERGERGTYDDPGAIVGHGSR